MWGGSDLDTQTWYKEKQFQLDVFGVDNPLLATAKFLYFACV